MKSTATLSHLVRARFILAATMTLLAAESSAAKTTTEPAGDTQALWPAGAPGIDRVSARETYVERTPQGPLRDRYVEHVTRPAITLFRPADGPIRGRLLIVPGGGYVRVVIDKEGFESAQWFASRGFECAVLRYRLPGDGWPAGADAPVHDIRRALRVLRAAGGATAAERAIPVGIMGFSAGGHAVARFITEPDVEYPRVDPKDDISARADFAVLMYPVIATTGSAAHAGSAQQLLAAGVAPASLGGFSPPQHVGAHTPRTLLVHAADDDAVPVENSLMMFEALRKAGVRTELHVFDLGGHGFGLRGVAGKDVAAWPLLVENWALNHAAAH